MVVFYFVNLNLGDVPQAIGYNIDYKFYTHVRQILLLSPIDSILWHLAYKLLARPKSVSYKLFSR